MKRKNRTIIAMKEEKKNLPKKTKYTFESTHEYRRNRERKIKKTIATTTRTTSKTGMQSNSLRSLFSFVDFHLYSKCS